MNLLEQAQFIERIQFFNGQRLFATDLQDLEAFNREMRWLHNKSLHQAGIGIGLAVSGKRGDREVTIGPGYAIDSEGREIVLTRTHIEQVPPVAAEEDGGPVLFDLTISYPPDDQLEETEIRRAACESPGVIRLKEEPVFCWIELAENGQPKDQQHKQDIQNGLRIVLARAEVFNCKLNKDLSVAQRINARPGKQPYICCGDELPEWTPWILVPFDPVAAFSSTGAGNLFATMQSAVIGFPVIAPVGLQATIDTAQCEFKTTPCYTARISGQRVHRVTVDVPGDDQGPVDVTLLVDGLVQIVTPQPTSFTLQVLLIVQALLPRSTDFSRIESASKRDFQALVGKILPKNLTERLKSLDVEKEAQAIIDQFFKDWTVVWMGVEG